MTYRCFFLMGKSAVISFSVTEAASNTIPVSGTGFLSCVMQHDKAAFP